MLGWPNHPGHFSSSTSENGSTGSSVAIHQSLLLSALSFTSAAGTTEEDWGGSATNNLAFDASAAASTDTLVDTSFEASLFTKAVANIATLRAKNGGQVKRLQYAQADVESKITNMTAAHGRIMDVDIAAESSNLAKQQILVQAAAAMTAQANTANDVALLLLR